MISPLDKGLFVSKITVYYKNMKKDRRYSKVEIITTQPIAQGGISLSSITGFDINNPQIGQVIVYDGTNWINAGLDLDDLTSVNLGGLATGDVLQYNGTDWINVPLSNSVSVNAPLTGDGTSGSPLSISVDVANGVAGLDSNIRHNINDFNASIDIYGGLAPTDFWQTKHDGTGALSFIYNNGIGDPKAIISNVGSLTLDSNILTSGNEDVVQGIFKANAAQSVSMLEVRNSSNVSMAGFLKNGGIFSKPAGITIASDSIDVNGYSAVVLSTEAAAAEDFLSTITGSATGQVLMLRPSNSGQEVVVVNSATMQLKGGANYRLHNSRTTLTLYCINGATNNWMEIARSDGTQEHKTIGIVSGDADITNQYTDWKDTWLKIDTEGLAATDDLDSITGGVDGAIITLSTTSTARDVVIKHGTGNIRLNGGADRTLSSVREKIVLIYETNTVNIWQEISYSANGL